MEQECLPNGLLYNTLVELKSLLSKKIIPSKVFSFSKKDVLFHLDNTLCGAAFLTLSEHRTIDRQVINKYKSIYCPAIDISSIRNFSAPEYVMVISLSITLTSDASISLKPTNSTNSSL